MAIRKPIAAVLVGLFLVILAACTPQTGELPGTGEEQTPAVDTPTASPEALPAAVLEAQRWLSEQLGVPVEGVEIVEMERASWTDSCLGLGQLNESCAQVVTPGWRVTLNANGQDYEVRTDEAGSVVRQVTASGEESLTHTQWRLESFGAEGAETPVITGTTITLEFGEGGQAGGSGGCNTYGTEYTVQEGRLTFSQVISTEMACLQEGVMDQEQRYYQALQAAGEFELAGERLVISYDDGQGSLNFVRTQEGAPTETPGALNPLANTQWSLESFGPAGAETPVAAGASIILEFGEGNQAGGSGGCNSYGAEYRVEGRRLTFDRITSTLMACADEAVTLQEQRYFQALETTGVFELSADRLVVSYDDGASKLIFVKTEGMLN